MIFRQAKMALPVWLCGLLLVSSAFAADLGRVRSVYTWPMTRSFDQYLAEQITTESVFDVVVDPKLANAVLTDRIDSHFLAAMDELFPLPEPDDPAETEQAATEKKDEVSNESIEAGGAFKRPVNRPMGSPRGTLFLVDVHSRTVLWSTYLKEYDPSPNKLHQQARSVVKRIKEQMGVTP